MCNLIIHSSHTSICIHLLPDKFPISFQLMKPNSNKRGNMHEVEMGLLNHSIGQMGSEENGTSTTTTMENENCLFPQVREIDSKWNIGNNNSIYLGNYINFFEIPPLSNCEQGNSGQNKVEKFKNIYVIFSVP